MSDALSGGGEVGDFVELENKIKKQNFNSNQLKSAYLGRSVKSSSQGVLSAWTLGSKDFEYLCGKRWGDSVFLQNEGGLFYKFFVQSDRIISFRFFFFCYRIFRLVAKRFNKGTNLTASLRTYKNLE